MAAGVQRVFLGWDGSALDRAAKWILEERGEDLGNVLVALPGSRAARTLREKLALHASPSWTPPEILTTGALIDAIVETDRPVAGRLARTLAWARALGDLPRERLELLAARPPEKDDLRGALALAETVRALHADLAEEGIGFERVTDAPRFEVLAEAQRRWRRILDDLGLADPHESRFAAIDAGRLGRGREVILVGVADMNRLFRHLVEKLGRRATALVVAPDSESATFDELGCLRTEAWKDRDLDVPLDRWHVADGPDAQAECAVEILAGLGGKLAPEEVTLGLCDEEVTPCLVRRLAEEHVVAHHAAGTPIEGTRPYRLLVPLSAWLARGAFGSYAELLRHPDLEAAIRTATDVDLPAALDAYHAEHLPATVDGAWLRKEDAVLRPAHEKLRKLLGDLAGDPRPLAEWPARIRTFLAAVYAGDLDPRAEGDRVLAGALTLLSDALEEIERLPGSLGATPVPPADAIDLLLATVRGGAVGPRPPSSGEPVVEMLGWLELPLDEARALVVTGFQDGLVPSARRDDPFLPDSLRRKLGLPSADDRVARDVYAATVLLASGKEVAFVSGRRNRQGDPLLPSRLLFHVPKQDLLPRVDHAMRAGGGGVPAIAAREAEYQLPRIEGTPAPESMSVTSFADYIRSPYAFYLRHVLRAETIDDSAREMDGRCFGSLAHEVFQAFGRGEAKDATDPRKIAESLKRALDALALAQFGRRPWPAVGLQIAQFARRLEFFAEVQAKRAAEGWRIVEVEWAPRDPVALEIGPGEAPMILRGKIDRIDAREKPGSTEREWAILDYKTGGKAADPEKHRTRDGEWTDLQLPLYTLLARGIADRPHLGIFSVGKDSAETGIRFAAWDESVLESAIEAARDVARNVRRGTFFELGDGFPDDLILRAIAGQGLVASVSPEGENGEGGEDAA